MNSIFFSIVIPTYNSKDTIIRCLESCLNQSYRFFEIIIIDDCSVDGTMEIIRNYRRMHSTTGITIVELEKNKGVSVARNKGISIAKGDYIALLDSDDYFSLNKLEIINNILLNNPNIDLLGHDYNIDKDDFKDNHSIKVIDEMLKQINCSKLLFKNFAVTPSIVFKKKISISFNEAMRYTEDHDFFLRICFHNYKIYYLDLALVYLNRSALSEGGLSANKWAMRKGELQMYRNIVYHKKSLLPLFPFLILFSLAKHLRWIVKDILGSN